MAPVAVSGPRLRGPSHTPHFGTQQGIQPHPSPVSAVWNSGFENQVAPYVVDGGGLCDAVVGTPGTATDQAYSGAASLKIVQAASAQYIKINVASTAWLVLRFYFRLLAAPTGGDLNLLEAVCAGSKGFLSVLNGTTTMLLGNDTVFAGSGATLNTGQWYRVDVSFDGLSTPNVYQWMLDGVAQTSLTTSQPSQIFTSVNFGNRFAATATCWYDDAIISTNLPDYPIGPGYSKVFVPNGKGTHAPGAGAFQDDTAAAITDAGDAAGQSWLRLDEQPPNATDFITQTAADTNGYLEYALADSAEGNPPNSVSVFFAAHAASAASCDISVKTNDNGTITAGSTRTMTLTSEVYSREVLTRRPSTGQQWTESDFNNLLLRAGYAVDATPNPRIDAVWVEVDYAGAAPSGNQTVNAPAATASGSAPTPTVQLQVAPAAATASASAPTPIPQLQIAPAAATASASAPVPTVALQVAPAAATATASAPGPVMPIVVPVATASANSPPATLQLQVAVPAATATASAPLPTVKLQVAPAAATASASAPTPAVALRVSPAAATATASAPTPTLKEQVSPGADTAAGSAPTPGVALQLSPAAATASASAPIPIVTSAPIVTPPAATATASAPLPTVALRVSPASATASVAGLTPTPALQVSPPAATASASAPTPTEREDVPSLLATATASAPIPTVTVAASGTVNAPIATASASAPTPKIHHIFFDIAELWHHHENGLGEYPIAPGLSLNTSELFNQRYRDNSKAFPVTGDPTLTVDLEKLWDQKYRDTSVPFPVDQL